MRQPSLFAGYGPEEHDGPSSARDPRAARRLARGQTLGVAAAAAALLLAAFSLTRIDGQRVDAAGRQAPTGEATLVIETQPAGWQVWDGAVQLGVTPLTARLPAGRRMLSLRRDGATRQLEVDLAAGSRAAHRLELLPNAASAIGDLRVVTIPPGAIVAVDGIARGVTPVDVRDLSPGAHVVSLIDRDRVISQSVTVKAGGLGSLIVPLHEAGTPMPAVGWLVVRSPVDLEVFEGESLAGSSRNQRLLFMPGRHALRLVNHDLGVDMQKVVDIRPGESSTVLVTPPTGLVSINATPWAEVLIDGVAIGETPIAGYEVAVGAHDLTLRHPTLGEMRRNIVVSLAAPVRLGVDLRR